MSPRARFDRMLRVRTLQAREAAAVVARARAEEERESAMLDRLRVLAVGYRPTSGDGAELRRVTGFAHAVADARRTTTEGHAHARTRVEAVEVARRDAEVDRRRAEKLRDAAGVAERRAAAKAAAEALAAAVGAQTGTLPALLRANASDGEAATGSVAVDPAVAPRAHRRVAQGGTADRQNG